MADVEFVSCEVCGAESVTGKRCFTCQKPPQCEWFAKCTNPADGYLFHPILGYVPICQRCADRVDTKIEIGVGEVPTPIDNDQRPISDCTGYWTAGARVGSDKWILTHLSTTPSSTSSSAATPSAHGSDMD